MTNYEFDTFDKCAIKAVGSLRGGCFVTAASYVIVKIIS